MPYTRNRSTYVLYTGNITRDYGNINNKIARKMLLERVRVGDANPRWRKSVAAHENATTNMSGTFETITDSVPIGSFLELVNTNNLPSKRQRETVSGFHTEDRYLPTSDTHANPVLGSSSAMNRAMTTAFKQVRSAQIAMSGGVFLGELKEAVHMLRHPAQALRSHLGGYLTKLSKAKKAKPKKWLDTLSQTWLESSFGWRPFVNDLEDAMKAYNEVTKNAQQEFRHIRAVGKDNALVSQLNESFSPIGNFRHKGSCVVRDEAICIIRGEVKREAVVTTVDKLKVFGLTPSEFLPTAWELLPWSFLVDYFTNIGDIIEAGATDTSSVAWLCMANVRKRITKATMYPDLATVKQLNGNGYISGGGNQGSFSYERKIVARQSLPALTFPTFKLEVPSGTIKELNLLALFTQANSIHTQDTGKLRGRTFR